MAIKKLQPNLQGADLEKIKAVCYPCYKVKMTVREHSIMNKQL